MSSFPSASTIHVSPSPSSREHPCDSVGVILRQGGCLTYNQGQVMGTELGLMEMTEVEYTHLQHFIQANMEAQAAPPDGPDVRSHPAAVMVKDATVISLFPTNQAIDLSSSAEDLVIPGENTPASYGEVPGFVLARIRGENSLTESPDKSSPSSQKRSRSAARVCLEKRFDTMSADTPIQEDIQSAFLSNFFTMLQQSAEAQETVTHPQMQKWMKTDRANPSEVTTPYVGGVYNPVTNMCGQVIGHNPHMVEPNKHEGSIISKSFSLKFCPERVVTKAHFTSSSNATEQQLMNIENDLATPAASRKHDSAHSSRPKKAAKIAPDSAGKSRSSTRKTARSCMSHSQRREKHNSKERERRKMIRLCCDELNMLVPFCDSYTDKVTTLQWTAAFLKYINKTYGDTFKEEFQSAFTAKKGLFLKSSPSSGQDPFQQEKDEAVSIPLVVEQ